MLRIDLMFLEHPMLAQFSELTLASSSSQEISIHWSFLTFIFNFCGLVPKSLTRYPPAGSERVEREELLSEGEPSSKSIFRQWTRQKYHHSIKTRWIEFRRVLATFEAIFRDF